MWAPRPGRWSTTFAVARPRRRSAGLEARVAEQLAGGAAGWWRGRGGAGAERRGAVRRAETGRAVVAGAGGAQVRRRAGAVAAAGHVVQVAGVRVRVRRRRRRRRPGRRPARSTDAMIGDGGAGAAVDRPAAAAVGVVDRDAGVRVGDRGDVGDRCACAQPVSRLPGRLGVVRRAAAAGAGSRRSRSSRGRWPSRVSEVPPTAVTYGETAGYSTP